MKVRIKIMFYMAFFIFGDLIAQTKTTKEAKVIAVVNNDVIEAIVHFDGSRKSGEILRARYPKAKFFLGFLKGNYEIKDEIVIPKNEATVTIYTESRLFSESALFDGKKMALGDELIVGKAKAKVVASKKGELTLKTAKE